MRQFPHPHQDKLEAACANAKCSMADRELLNEALERYQGWVRAMDALALKGRQRVDELVRLLNEYKDALEVDLLAKRGSAFLKRQKGQLKLDNSVIEEFLPRLVCQEVMTGLRHTRFTAGPQAAFMSLAFMPSSFERLGLRPEVVVKMKDQDFAIGSAIHFKFSADKEFAAPRTASGVFTLAVVAAEVKVNLDKTMFQEAAGTAARLKQGCPVAKYYVLAEYLDMTPEDPRLTAIDNVFLLRKTRRLPFEKRDKAAEVAGLHKDNPISADVVWKFAKCIRTFIDAIWYDPHQALRRGSFI